MRKLPEKNCYSCAHCVEGQYGMSACEVTDKFIEGKPILCKDYVRYKMKRENKWTCGQCRNSYFKHFECAYKNKDLPLCTPACKKFNPDFTAMARELGPDRMLQVRMLQSLLTQINALQMLGKGTDMKEAYNELLEQTEDVLQKAWKMGADKSWHTYWLKVPGCTCPKTDNIEHLGVDNDRIISNDCPIHGAQK